MFGDYHPYGFKVDWQRALMRLACLGYDDDGSAELWRWTLDLLREHEDMITTLAAALMDARWLSGDEIDALLAQYLCRS